MKITKNVYRRDKYTGVATTQQVEVSVEDAIENILDNTHAEGELERLRDLIRNQQKFIAALVQRLYDTDRLSAEFIKEHISYELTIHD